MKHNASFDHLRAGVSRCVIILLGSLLSACHVAGRPAPQAPVEPQPVQIARSDVGPDTVVFSKDPKVPGRWFLSSSKTGALIAVTEGEPDSRGVYRVRLLNRPSSPKP